MAVFLDFLLYLYNLSRIINKYFIFPLHVSIINISLFETLERATQMAAKQPPTIEHSADGSGYLPFWTPAMRNSAAIVATSLLSIAFYSAQPNADTPRACGDAPGNKLVIETHGGLLGLFGKSTVREPREGETVRRRTDGKCSVDGSVLPIDTQVGQKWADQIARAAIESAPRPGR